MYGNPHMSGTLDHRAERCQWGPGRTSKVQSDAEGSSQGRQGEGRLASAGELGRLRGSTMIMVHCQSKVPCGSHIFHTSSFTHHLSHILFHTPSFTHHFLHTNFVTHQLCHTNFVTHTQLVPTQLVHTQLVHTQLAHRTTCPHTTCPHITCSHTTWPHTTCSHTTSPHTQLAHTQLVHTQLAHTQLVRRRGTYGTGLALVARLGLRLTPRSPRRLA